MKGEDIKIYLIDLRGRILKDDEEAFNKGAAFSPHEWHIYLAVSRKGGDAVAYFDYDPDRHLTIGINKELVPKVSWFLYITGHAKYIKEVRESI